MELPPGFYELMEHLDTDIEHEKGVKYALYLKKAIYGLKQSSRLWFHTLRDILIKDDGDGDMLVQSDFDECLYLLKGRKGALWAMLLVFVDDIVILAKNTQISTRLKKKLSRHFNVTDQGDLRWILGIQVKYVPCQFVSFSINKYMNDLLERFGDVSSTVKELKVPLPDGTVLIKEGEQRAWVKLRKASEPLNLEGIKHYQQVVGSLMYAVSVCRFDTCMAVYSLACYLHAPTKTHLKYAYHVLRFLIQTKEMELKINVRDFKLTGFVDSNWATSSEGRRSISGYCFTLSPDGGAFSVKCRRQKSVALSSAEAEYLALALCIQEAAYLKQLLEEMLGKAVPAITIYLDNRAAELMARMETSSARTKHIDIRYYFVREMVDRKVVNVAHIEGTNNPADIFTKNLGKKLYIMHSNFVLGHGAGGESGNPPTNPPSRS